MAVKVYYNENTKRWRVRCQETYKGITWTCTGTSRESAADARRAYRHNREEKIAQIDGEQERKEGKVKLKIALPEWYDTHMRNKMTHGRPRSLRTIQTDLSTMAQINKALGDYDVCNINADLLQRYLNTLSANVAGESTVRKQWILLNQYFQYIDRRNNPLADCHKPLTQDIQAQYNGDVEEKTAYTDEEMERLTKALFEIGTVRSRMLILVLWQFTRIGEAIELRVKDIDLDAGVIHICRQYDECHKAVVRPKDNSVRDIPVSWRCRKILEDACSHKVDHDLVFLGGSNNHEGRMLRSASLDTLALACTQAGLPRHTVHDLRHDGISYYVRMGYKPVTIQQWAGHSSLTVTLDKYYRDTDVNDPRDLALMTTGQEPGTFDSAK